MRHDTFASHADSGCHRLRGPRAGRHCCAASIRKRTQTRRQDTVAVLLRRGGDPAVDRLPLKDTRVDVAITGVIADVTVRQVYENHGQRPLHARYVFPASTRAAVYGMTMTIGDDADRGEDQGARAGEAATSRRRRGKGKSASLLEQSRPNVFTMNVANVLPGDTILVELKYTELLVPTDGVYEFVYPTVVGPRYSREARGRGVDGGPAFVKTPYTHARASRRKASSISRARCRPACRSRSWRRRHTRSTVAQQRPGPRGLAARLTPSDSGQSRLHPSLSAGGPEDWRRDCCSIRATDENFFLLMAEPPQAVVRDEIPPREYVFVLDVSGFDVRLSAGHRQEADGRSRQRAPSHRHVQRRRLREWLRDVLAGSVPATDAESPRALQFIGASRAAAEPSCWRRCSAQLALPRETRSVAQRRAVDRWLHRCGGGRLRLHPRSLDEANFFAFGIGSSVNRYLIEGVARAGLGEPFIVTGPGRRGGSGRAVAPLYRDRRC